MDLNNKHTITTKQVLLFILKLALAFLIFWTYIRFEDLEADNRWFAQIRDGLQSFLIPSIIFSIIRFIIITIYNARNENRFVRGNFVLGLNRLIVIANAISAVIALMIVFGINPAEFVTSLTIVAMAIAVTFRDYITNMISGLIIMFSDELSVGDRIRLGTQQGRIMDITLAHIVVQDEEEDIVMIPNNMVFTSTFVNLSAHQSSLFSVRFELPIHLAVEIESLEKVLRESLLAHPNLTSDEELELKVLEIGKDYVKCRMDLHALGYSNKLHRRLENEILKEILKFEKEASKSS